MSIKGFPQFIFDILTKVADALIWHIQPSHGNLGVAVVVDEESSETCVNYYLVVSDLLGSCKAMVTMARQAMLRERKLVGSLLSERVCLYQ